MSEREILTAAKKVLRAYDAEAHEFGDLWEAMEELRRAVHIVREVIPGEEGHHPLRTPSEEEWLRQYRSYSSPRGVH